jgi:hypothetical protein
MSAGHTVLLVGGTGRTGARVLEQLLACGVSVRAIVRSADRLPKGAAQDPRLEVILMSSVSVNRPGGLDTRRGTFERAVVWILRGVVPSAKDNQRAADFLCLGIGTANPYVQWVAVRPDTLLQGDVSEYSLHDGLVSSLFAPDSTNMANVAHFICELATNSKAWNDWKGAPAGSPVPLDAEPIGPARVEGTHRGWKAGARHRPDVLAERDPRSSSVHR